MLAESALRVTDRLQERHVRDLHLHAHLSIPAARTFHGRCVSDGSLPANTTDCNGRNTGITAGLSVYASHVLQVARTHPE